MLDIYHRLVNTYKTNTMI